MWVVQNLILKSAIGIVFLALIYPQLSVRFPLLWILLYNRPEKLAEVNTFVDYSVKFSDQIRNCEDGLLIEEYRVGVLSCDPGRDYWNTVMGTFAPDLSNVPAGGLFLYRYDSARFQDSEALAPIELRDFPAVREFHPLGIEYHKPSSSLLVSNHHYNGSRIEVFSLDLESSKPIARHKQTIMHPLIRSPNSITALSDHEFYVSNDHYFLARENPLLNWMETYAQLPLGSVSYVNLATGSQPVEVRSVAQVPFANGVTLLNATTLAVSSTSTATVRFFEILQDRALQATGSIRLPFMPDNLSTDKRGSLLITGHPHPPTLDKLRKKRFDCLMAGENGHDGCLEGSAPSWVSEWSANDGLKTVYVSKDGFSTSCTAVRDSDYNLGFATGLYEKGILVWKM